MHRLPWEATPLRIAQQALDKSQLVAARAVMLYDKENRLAVYESGSSVTCYVYGGDNLKRLEIVGSATTTLVWDGDDYLQARQ